MLSPLPERLKTATRPLHTVAERAPFMAALLRGQLGVASYRELLVNLHVIYRSLEGELDRHRADPAIAAIWFPGLARTRAIESDLAALPAASNASSMRPSALAYAHRLLEIGHGEPRRLIAHAYVRFLGDLSGGQLLQRIVADKLGAPIAFYDFGNPAQVDVLRVAFCSGLARIEIDEHETNAVVDEALQAFDRHVALFDQLSRTTGPPQRDAR